LFLLRRSLRCQRQQRVEADVTFSDDANDNNIGLSIVAYVQNPFSKVPLTGGPIGIPVSFIAFGLDG
jgi:hypothetical protein